MPKITSFVARSFHPEDESKITPIIRHLDTFHDLGFTWGTAERADMESVSEKVCHLIDSADVFVGILTRRYPVFDLSDRWRTAYKIVTRTLSAAAWTPPLWVIQEAGYAQRAGLKLLLFREEGVEIPGLQADLEYIEFAAEKYTSAFQRANEMINRFIGQKSGILVETSVSTVAPEGGNKEQSPEEPEPKEDATTPEKKSAFINLLNALHDQDFEKAAGIYQAEAERIKKEEPGRSVLFEALYWRWRFVANDEHALDSLRALAEREPTSWHPRARIAESLSDFNEFVPAGNEYLEAADLTDGKRAAELTISAAEAFRKGKKLARAKDILLGMLDGEHPQFNETRGEALKELYEVFKDAGERYHALAIGELALYENPALGSLRFKLAYDYDEWKYVDMSIYHYALLCEKQPDNSSAIHNLGVAYSKGQLDIRAVEAYKKAFELGETLGAKNLANKYLYGGMADDASALVKSAMEKPKADPGLSEVLSAIEEKHKTELKKAKSFEKSAETQRGFALSFSAGLLTSLSCDVGGMWSFPFAPISLNVAGLTMTGTGESSETIQNPLLFSSLSALAGSTSSTHSRTKKFTLSATLSGRTCRFRVKSEIIEPDSYKSITGSADQVTEGLMVFSETCNSAQVAELKDGIPSKYYDLKKT